MSKTGTEDRWTLHGQLMGPWVSELRTVWRNTRVVDKQRRCVFDLNEVTFVDKAGEKLLRVLAKQGVRFEANGIYVRGVLKQLEGKGDSGDRSNVLRARVDEDDAVLVDADQNGDVLAFETLVKRHHRRILAIAVRYTRTRHDAEDVFQESVQKAFV